MTPNLPCTRDVVFVGGGHSHALVLRKWGMRPLAGARLTLINPGPTAPYSGMLPGFVAGHYPREALDIDLVRLARFAGARLILGAATHLDPARKEVHVAGRPPVAYDLCTLDIGITSDMPALPGFADHAIPAKPLGPFAARWHGFLQGTGAAHVAVLGAGVAGVELALAMAHALTARGREATVHLIDSAEALTAVRPASRAILLQALSEAGVQLHTQTRVTAIGAGHITLADGRQLRSDFTTGAAGARPYGWLAQAGLRLQDGFVDVDATLRSSDPDVFATGDCAHLGFDPRPKAGVYAVRQAPVLYDNLRAALTGTALRPYKPQKDYLKLISLGQTSALGERFGRAFAGPWVWRWKDRIDQGFMNRFRDLPQMESPALPPVHVQDLPEALGTQPLCGGCGAKVGRGALQAALQAAPSPGRADVTALPGDDAALLTMGDTRQVISTDHLRRLTDDPVVMARIAAVHALGDIWAMGAAPQAATATVILPRLSPALQQRTLSEIMSAAGQVMAEAGADIVGGHSSMGDEMTLGFTVTGLCERAPLTLAGARPGDHLILTKPLGSGVMMAADMAGAARGKWVARALAAMMQPQGTAARILAPCAHAMTDVTGFGLAGHLSGMCQASGVGATLDLAAVPVLEGADVLSQQGIRSTIYAQNRALVPDLSGGAALDLLFDPQTAGGLLAAVPEAGAEAGLRGLQEAGYDAAVIGQITEGPAQLALATGT